MYYFARLKSTGETITGMCTDYASCRMEVRDFCNFNDAKFSDVYFCSIGN